jgi:uncharacterized protein DUF1761
MTFVGINHLAVLIAAVAGWIAGAAWYMSLGKYWMAALGMTTDQMGECRKRPYAWVPFVLAFLANLLMAWALAGILGHFGQVTIANGVITGALCWLGFVITSMTVNNAFAMRPYRLTLIDGGHYLLVLVVIGAIIGAMGA